MSQHPLSITDINTILDNVQGDVLGDGFLKQVEFFDFFQIVQPGDFRKKLAQVIPLIANVRAQKQERARVANEILKINAASDTTSQDARDKSVASKQANIAFSSVGLQKLRNAGGNFDTNISPANGGTDNFQRGMEADAVGLLSDPPIQVSGSTPKWNDAFLGRKIDGVFLIAANNEDQANQLRNQLFSILGSTIREVINVPGTARQGQLRRHEHFGFLDGVSEPGIVDFDTLTSDQKDKQLIQPGIILCGRSKDTQSNRPAWTTDGTFLAFRWLEQKVPEFRNDWGKFATQLGMADTPANREAIGARIIGRWQSGALITEFPNADPLPLSKSANMTRDQIAAVVNVNNKVDFSSGCPFGAHIRKMNPRDPSHQIGDNNRIVRRGIQFGPEVSQAENNNSKTDPNTKRGLLFASYQSSLELGYAFIQQNWANLESFPSSGAGVDPMVGQQNRPNTYEMKGMNKNDPTKPITIPFINPYVVPLGGEYFFVPSMTALNTVLADRAVVPPPQPPPSQTLRCVIENRFTGHLSNAAVPIDGVTHKISEIWGSDATGNWMSLSQWVPNNIEIIVTTANGQSIKLPASSTPVQVSSGPVDLSQSTIVGRVIG